MNLVIEKLFSSMILNLIFVNGAQPQFLVEVSTQYWLNAFVCNQDSSQDH